MNFISSPVLRGFASGAAIVTILSVIKDLLGIKVQKATIIIDIITNLIDEIHNTNITALSIGLVSMVILITLNLNKKTKKLPSALIIVFLGILISYVLNFQQNTVDVIKEIPSKLPSANFPTMTFNEYGSYIYDGIFIALAGFLESISISKVFASKHNYRINISQELFALGIVNIIGPAISSFPTMGAFSRSSLNESTGAKSTLSLIVSGLTVMLVILFLGPIVSHLPKSILAAIVIVAISKLIDYKGAKNYI